MPAIRPLNFLVDGGRVVLRTVDSSALTRLRELPLPPFAGGPHPHWVCIPLELVDGRRVGPAVQLAEQQRQPRQRWSAPLGRSG